MTDLKKIGLVLIEDFISENEEKGLISNLEKLPNPKANTMRDIWRFGKTSYYKSYLVADMLPDYLIPVCQKLFDFGYTQELCNGVTINRYEKGKFVAPHIDDERSGEIITILSLGNESDIIFERGKEKISVNFKPRTLIQLKDEVRYNWKHSIPKVDKLRYSLVFRHNK